jgi:hypothetical protein
MSFNIINLSNVRISNDAPVLTPAYRRADGTICDAKVEFKGFISERVKGKADRNTTLNFDLWGPRAVAFCRFMGSGKSCNIFGSLRSYKATKFAPPVDNGQGGQVFNPVLDQKGEPVKYDKMVIKVNDIEYGVESNKRVAAEIQAGIRGMYWNVPGTQDYVKHQANLEQLKTMLWDGQSATFGCARVRVVQGVVHIPMGEYLMSKGNNTAAAPAPAPAAATAQVQQAVTQALPAGAQVMAGGAVQAPAAAAGAAVTAPAGAVQAPAQTW